jgi:hypothetical protein
VELGGERTGVEVRANDSPLTDVGDGVFELPHDAPAGEYRIEAVRCTELMDDAAVALVDVAHAGSPTLVRGWADRFGRRHDTAHGGWAGGWVEAEGRLAFDFDLLVTPFPRSHATLQAGGPGNSTAVSLGRVDNS